jgi:hypothetical protein
MSGTDALSGADALVRLARDLEQGYFAGAPGVDWRQRDHAGIGHVAAALIGSVDVQPRVQIRPFELGHCAGDCDELVLVVLGGECVMRRGITNRSSAAT